MTEPILSGNTAACLEDFFRRYRWETVQRFLADFAKVEKPTVRRWYNGALPLGEELLKVRVMLDLVGYHVEEFRSLPEPSRQFAQAVALGLIQAEEAHELLGYKNIQGLYDMLLRGHEPVRHRWFRLERYVENSTDELKSAVAEFQARLGQLPLEAGHNPPPAERVAPPIEPPTPIGIADLAVEGLVYALKSAASLTSALFGGSLGDLDANVAELHRQIPPGEMEAILLSMDRLRATRD